MGMMALPADAHIGQVSLTVRDLDRAVSFYTEVLGFAVTGGGRDYFLSPPGGRVLIELRELSDAVPRPRRSTGLYHFAILVPSRAALGRSLRRLADRQWPMSGAADHLVSEALYLNDPDGLGIEIYRDRPRDEWRRSAAGELAMSTDPLDLQAVADEAGADTPWSGLEAATTMGHVHLHAAHLDAAEAFYCGRVGFEPTVRAYPGALFVAAGGYHHHLGLNTWAGVGAPPPPANAVGLRSFTIESSSVQPQDLHDDATRVTVSLIRT
jgi:catechol 2,3-dioxygenase